MGAIEYCAKYFVLFVASSDIIVLNVSCHGTIFLFLIFPRRETSSSHIKNNHEEFQLETNIQMIIGTVKKQN